MTKDFDSLQVWLRAKGLKLTRPRKLVAEKLLSTGGHRSADELIDLLKRDGTPVARASVYRALLLLQESGFFDAHDFGGGRKVYEKAVGRPHHDHLFCIGCGEVIEFQEEGIERLQERVTKRHQFKALYHSHKIFGYCKKCGNEKRHV
jgi:Fur family ferric uptake transcriptional regulator